MSQIGECRLWWRPHQVGTEPVNAKLKKRNIFLQPSFETGPRFIDRQAALPVPGEFAIQTAIGI